MKIAVLCNSLLGLPSIQSLAQNGCLTGIGVTDAIHDATTAIKELGIRLNIPVTVFQKASFNEVCERWLLEKFYAFARTLRLIRLHSLMR